MAEDTDRVSAALANELTLSRWIQKYWLMPVFLRKRFRALMMRFSSPSGTFGSLVVSESFVVEGERENFRVSPRSMTWNREARSW